MNGDRKVDQLGTLQLKNNMAESSLAFLFASFILDWALEKPTTYTKKSY